MEMNELLLYGTVGSSWWDEEYFTAKTVREALAGMSGPITVRINSGGGIATEGQAIYSALRGYAGAVDVVIEGVAASAASLIAMAGDTITMSPGAILMIHDPASWYVDGRGTEDDHLKAAQTLGVIANAYAGIYARRAGIDVEEARAVMKAETYFDGVGAVDAGFATDVETDGEEVEPAAFDYRIYQHAPARLLSAAGTIQRRRPRASVLAMMAGIAPKPAKGAKAMAKTKPAPKGRITRVTASDDEEDPKAEDEEDPKLEDQEEEDPQAEGDEEDPKAEDGDDDDPTTEGDEEEPQARGAEVTAILAFCDRNRLGTARALDFVNRGLTLEQVVAEHGGKGKDKVKITSHGPSARILQDERDTRRRGIGDALEARMSGSRDVRGPGRDYMALTVPEMAAAASDHRGRIARGAGELRVIEMAFGSHSTSDFPAIFENALNRRLAAAYELARPVYQLIAERIDFTDFRPHPISQVGDWPSLLPVGETGEIKYGTVSDKKESVILIPYARAFHISRQMMVNDDLMAIERLLSTRGRAVAAFEDATFFAMMLSGANADGPTLLETTRQVFNTTDGTKASANAAITPTSIALGYEAMRKRKGVGADANFLAVTPSILLTGPAKEFEGMQLLAPIQAAQASNVNPYVGKMQQATSPYITGNGWYLFASPGEVPVFMYGYLQGEAGPRLRMDEPFGRQGIGYSVELDFGCGATDFRGGFKNAGG